MNDYKTFQKHKDMNLTQLHKDVLEQKANGQVLWQPRIICWYEDRIFNGGNLPEPYQGMSVPQLYQKLGCSNRIYDYGAAIKRIDDPRVIHIEERMSETEVRHTKQTPMGSISCIQKSNTSNNGIFPSKWWVESEQDMKVAMWIEERCTYEWDEEKYQDIQGIWKGMGLPCVYVPRVNIQALFIEHMGVEGTIYALMDYPELVESFFRILDDSAERYIEVLNSSPIQFINFADNIHGGVLPPAYFEKYVLPTYIRRNELLHKEGKFTYAHWDGDVKNLLPYAGKCGLDGIEAITPKPQGDVTLEEIKDALGDEVFLIDGIAAVLFDDMYPVEDLINQTNKLIELFAPKLILGISDEMSSTGNIERVRLVGEIVDDYNKRILETPSA